MQHEIDLFHKKIKARALLVAIEWAGNVDRLSRMAGLSRYAGIKWVARQAIPPLVAVSLSRIEGFPLSFNEMSPDVNLRTLNPSQARCPHCRKRITPPNNKPGHLPLLRSRSEAAARKMADDTQSVAKRKLRAAK